MKVTKSSAIKLLFLIAAVSIYTLVSFADSGRIAEPARSEPARSEPPDSGADKDGAKTGSKNSSAGAQDQPRLVRSKKLFGVTEEEARKESEGCLDCHNGIEDMHSGVISLGCGHCHGGHPEVRAAGLTERSPEWLKKKEEAHVKPTYPEEWKTAANPERSYTLLLKENKEFVQFINPGDLRVAGNSCGTSECHSNDYHNVRKSMMTTGAMLWGAALYNNGAFMLKNYRFGESYSPDGVPQRVQTNPPPTPEELKKGVLPFLDPLPRWEISQISNILRTFELGGRKAAEIGQPQIAEPPGKPTQNLLSLRGLGTNLRTDPVYIGLQKTRLLDPMLSLLGTNDQPGDYRSSGCTACHVPYANNRDKFEAGPWAEYGHDGFSASGDRMIPKDKSGHPIKHQLTRAIPSSQCVVCHMHPGTLVMMSYLGSTWWDLETDGKFMYPKEEKDLSAEQRREIVLRNPEESALRGNWGDLNFLRNLQKDINPQLKHTQFADFNGHGWVYRYVFAKDRKGNLLDAGGRIIKNPPADALQRAMKETTENPDSRENVPVHLKDIHIEKGMHCVDCHFKQDNHGNGKLYGEVRNAIEIDCVDCHGTITKRADPTSREARTSAAAGGNPMTDYRGLPSGYDRFVKKPDPDFPNDRSRYQLWQRAAVSKNPDGTPVEWRVKQVMDSITAGSKDYNEKAALAKTITKSAADAGKISAGGRSWGDPNVKEEELAHANSRMTCFACHTSWTPSCFGCHLKQQANQQKPMLHNEGSESLRNYTSYNFQTLRDDVFMLGKDGSVTGRRFAPVRSACAVVVSSQNAQREWIYSQQQTVSAEGYSGVSFSSHFPHTVRTRETRGCTDCHLSENNDNNAYMAMTLMQGTNFYNFLGRFVYVGVEAEGFEAVVVTERDEPQAVIGSSLHALAFPESYKKHVEGGKKLKEFYEHPGNDIINALNPFKKKEKTEVLSLTLRGEFLYAATGEGGLRVYDVANIDQKGFSERMTSAPFSPIGQRLYVKTKFATAVASPATIAVDPTRKRYPENEEGENRDDKQAVPLVYAFLYVTDREEGFIVIGNPLKDKNGPGVATLLDGNPRNNFIQRAVTFNPEGKLKGANNVIIAGTYAYVTADRGLFIIDLKDPLNPRIVREIGEPFLKKPRAVQVQFRYAFVCDEEGVKVIDVTSPESARPIEGSLVPVKEAYNIYLVRTYAYVAAGKEGLVIIDIENPEKPKQFGEPYNAEGKIKDARDVKTGMTNVSLFAYVADGEGHALHVLELISPDDSKPQKHYGWSPEPKPKLIATKALLGPALAISEGTDRDRAVDESGYQLAVFGRKGARPLNFTEMQNMYMRDGKLFTVPEIRDSNTKENADIRRKYGKPGQQENASEEQKKLEEQKKSEEPRKSARLEGPFGYSLTGELIGLAVLFLPFVATFARLRRRGKRR